MPGTRDRWRMGTEARALLLVTAVLVAFGLAVLHSASALYADSKSLDGFFFVRRQATGVLVGIVAFAICAKVDAERWRALAWPIMGLSLLLMLVVVLPFTKGIAPEVNGARRYLYGGSIQPSELAKFAVLIWVPMLLQKKGAGVRHLGTGLLPFGIVIGALSLLAALEPDLSMAITYCLLTAVLLLVGGARLRHFVLFGAVGMALLAFEASQSEYVRERMASFFTPRAPITGPVPAPKDPKAWQQYQSQVAVGSGGALGVGYGRGNQQRGWLPLAYNDFIGSVVGEEFGFVGIAFLTVAFAGYGWLGFRIARQASSEYGRLLAIGLTFNTVFTAFVHLGVVIQLLPNTGLTLPFVSYGRSNLLVTLAMTGVLVNIGSTRERVYGATATDPSRTPLPA